jgi:hypothetical protein
MYSTSKVSPPGIQVTFCDLRFDLRCNSDQYRNSYTEYKIQSWGNYGPNPQDIPEVGSGALEEQASPLNLLVHILQSEKCTH